MTRLTATDVVTKFLATFGTPEPSPVPGGAFWVGNLQVTEAKLTSWAFSTFGIAPRRGVIADAWATLAAHASAGDTAWPESQPVVKAKKTRRQRG